MGIQNGLRKGRILGVQKGREIGSEVRLSR